MNNYLSEDSQAIILICSNLSIEKKEQNNIKPYTLREWNDLAGRLMRSPLNSPKAFFHYSSEEWKDNLNLTEDEIERLKRLLNNGAQLAFQLDKLNSSGIWITTRAENTYPTLLKNRLKQKCPIFIYCAGNPMLFHNKCVGIVGSRDIDEKALEFTKLLSERCSLDGYTIVSGGAKGVDTVSQNTALQNDGTVISIVSDSLSVKIKRREYREAIMKNNLLMISTFHPDMTFKAYNAMDRNKYIYSLSEFTVAVSSDYNKGGTWAGATENLKNNWVPMLVRNEDNIPKGNIELLKLRAIPLSREEISDKNVSVDSWISKNGVASNKLSEEQLSIEQIFINKQHINGSNMVMESDMKNTYQNTTNEIKSVESNVETNEPNKDESIIQVYNHNNIEETESVKITALDILRSYLLDILKEEKTIDELADILKVKKVQMQEWITRLVIEKYVKKLNKPIRYIKF